MTLRLQTWPKKYEVELGDLIPEEVPLDPRSFSHMLFVVEAAGAFHVSIKSKDAFQGHIAVKHKEESALCRAMYKVKEACVKGGVRLKPEFGALDLGASPGGWTRYLSGQVGKVVAVDPGEVEVEAANSRCKVVHIKQKSEDCLAELAAHGPYHFIGSDMNMHPEAAAKTMLSLSHLLEPEAYLVLTLKFVKRGKRNEEEMTRMAIETLSPDFDRFNTIWLLSNQSGEKTLLARKKAA